CIFCLNSFNICILSNCCCQLLNKDDKKREGEPPLIKGWIPFIGKALEFGKDAHKFLEEHKRKFGDVFTVQIAGKYMTFIMNPLLYPNVIKHGRQLDFHEFSNNAVPFIFGYPPTSKFPGLQEEVKRSFLLLQGDSLTPLSESMMGNLMLIFREDYLNKENGWKSASMYEFCNSIMFEATFLTLYGKPASASRHSGIDMLKNDFVKFDNMFPLLIAQIPIWLLGQTKTIRKRLINYFLSHQMSCWSNASEFIRTHSKMFEQYDMLTDVDKAGR
uniref:Cytochrome P450, family 7, subfamily B, polypeptide 1 n=1 Tax=Amphilophus citrinellus TaxID=61819 RepID=A0A3Q0SRM6_AMPCI